MEQFGRAALHRRAGARDRVGEVEVLDRVGDLARCGTVEAGHRPAIIGALADPRARSDLDELRELLSAWRDAKRTARDVVVGWVVRILLAALMLGMAAKLGMVALVRS